MKFEQYSLYPFSHQNPKWKICHDVTISIELFVLFIVHYCMELKKPFLFIKAFCRQNFRVLKYVVLFIKIKGLILPNLCSKRKMNNLTLLDE